MKQLLVALALLATASPLFANDEGGSPGYIPDYQELVREGYGPRDDVRIDLYREDPSLRTIPKPTQAFYGRDANGKSYIVYYGYTPVLVRRWDPKLLYSFGRPLSYFRKLMPESITDVNLDHYAVQVSNQYSDYAPGDFVARARAEQAGAVTTVQRTRTVTTTSSGNTQLPAIGEKPPQQASH